MRVKLIVVHSERGGEPRSYVLDQDAIVIGRAGTCDLPLDDPDRVVSKQHAELRVEGDALRAVDLGSKNHTFVDGERVGMSGLPVRDGAVLTMGPFQVTVQIERDVMVADDLDRTVFGAAFNPVGEEAEADEEDHRDADIDHAHLRARHARNVEGGQATATRTKDLDLNLLLIEFAVA